MHAAGGPRAAGPHVGGARADDGRHALPWAMQRPWSIMVVAAALGCGSARSAPSIGQRTSAAVPPPCVAVDGLTAWQSELFPSCPPPPLPTLAGICGDGGCARPCGASGGSMGMRGDTWDATYLYDPAGHWLGATYPSRDPVVCAWTGALLDGCTIGDWREDAIRADDGTLTAVVIGGDRADLRRDDHGRLVAIGDRALVYDGDGRLIQVGDRRTLYGADGRIVGERDPHHVWTWRYDPAGRLRQIVRERRPPPPRPPGASNPAPSPPPPDQADTSTDLGPDEIDLGLTIDVGEDEGAFDPDRRVQSFSYDDQGRLTQTLRMGAHEDDSSGTSFSYDCP